MSESNIETKVANLLEDIIINLGYDLYDVLYIKEGKDYYLRIIIDNEQGISIEDCEIVNNEINEILDEKDYIKEQYFLEISSPGLEKTLRKEKHFLKQIGNEIVVKLFTKIDKQSEDNSSVTHFVRTAEKKELIGILKEYNNKDITVQVEEKDIKIDIKNIALAKTKYNW